MAINLNILSIPLNGTGTEIPALNVTDPFEKYVLTSTITVTATGNYAIVPTGTPQQGTTFIFKYKASLDITTNSKTFSIFGQALTQNQLTSDLDIEAYYDTAAWIVEVKPSFTSAVVEAANLLANSVATTHIQNGAVTEVKLATNSVSTNKILNLNVTTGKIADLGVTDAKINDVNGSKVTNSTVTNAKLATMADQTVKGNISGGSANPSDIPVSTLVNASSWGLTGNSGTTAGTNFIGTTDAVDLVFKTANLLSGRINLSLLNTSFGLNALDVAATQGNTGIGASSLGNTTAQGNTGLGLLSGFYNVTGEYNTYLGYNATPASGDTALNNTIALGKDAEPDASFQFAIPDNVTTIKFKGIVYTLPTTNAAGVLTNDGSGVLTWV